MLQQLLNYYLRSVVHEVMTDILQQVCEPHTEQLLIWQFSLALGDLWGMLRGSKEVVGVVPLLFTNTRAKKGSFFDKYTLSLPSLHITF